MITLEALQIEMRAGRISEEHEREALQQLEESNLDELNFIDFLVRFQSIYDPTFFDLIDWVVFEHSSLLRAGVSAAVHRHTRGDHEQPAEERAHAMKSLDPLLLAG